ncbi:MAG TPA: DUF3566 domain-containing protein [Acidimicrobiales bacterium]|nr:DUF3566 domain-containing protein [Acidimicrobiales bacterium]
MAEPGQWLDAGTDDVGDGPLPPGYGPLGAPSTDEAADGPPAGPWWARHRPGGSRGWGVDDEADGPDAGPDAGAGPAVAHSWQGGDGQPVAPAEPAEAPSWSTAPPAAHDQPAPVDAPAGGAAGVGSGVDEPTAAVPVVAGGAADPSPAPVTAGAGPSAPAAAGAAAAGAPRSRPLPPGAVPAGRRPGGVEPAGGPARPRPRPDGQRARGALRSRRLVHRIDVWSVFKVSVAFYALVVLVLVIAGIIVWNVADAFGLITSLEKSIRTLFSLKTFHLHAATTLLYSVLIGAVLCVFGALVNTLLATIYNLISDVVGGVQVVVVGDDE